MNKFRNNKTSNNNSNKLFGINRMAQPHNKNKNLKMNLKKYITRGNSKLLTKNINNFKNNNHSNTNSNLQISKYVNNFLNKNKQPNINKHKHNNNDESIKNRIYSSNYDIDDIEKNNLYINTNDVDVDVDDEQKKKFEEKLEKVEKEEKEEKEEKDGNVKENEDAFIKKDSSLDDTIKFSKCSSKVEDEGELGLEEVKDIIIYYNLGTDLASKNYLFKKNDYKSFIEKGKYKYINFFMK